MTEQPGPPKKSARGGARKGAGRPKTSDNVQMWLTVPSEVNKAVRANPDGARRALSDWVIREQTAK